VLNLNRWNKHLLMHVFSHSKYSGAHRACVSVAVNVAFSVNYFVPVPVPVSVTVDVLLK